MKRIDKIFIILFCFIIVVLGFYSNYAYSLIQEEAKQVAIKQMIANSNVITSSIQNDVFSSNYINAWYSASRSIKNIDGAYFILADIDGNDLVDDLGSQLKYKKLTENNKFKKKEINKSSYYLVSNDFKNLIVKDHFISNLDGKSNYSISYVYPLSFLEASISKISYINLALAAILIGIIALYFIIIRKLFNNSFTALGNGVDHIIKGEEITNAEINEVLEDHFEARTLLDNFKKDYDLTKRKLQEEAKLSALSKIATQVAHDIRSPLSVLEMSIFEEEQVSNKNIIQSAIQRINDIANNLLSENRTNTKGQEEIYLPYVIDSIITEKRYQYSKYHQLEIRFVNNCDNLNLFTRFNDIELKRILSNLINNSVESFANRQGIIEIILTDSQNDIFLEIKDNGHGIEEDILDQLRKNPFSHKKEGGNGIGLSHAMQTAQKYQASLALDSQVGHGTTIRLTLKRTSAPRWFSSSINLSKFDNIIVLDDDYSIHELWNKRLSGLKRDYHIINLNDPLELSATLSKLDISKTFIICDYEFVHESLDGIDTIIENDISKNSILITSHFNEDDLQERCLKNSIKMAPKNLARLIELHEFGNMSKGKQVVYLDDDRLLTHAWKTKATKNGVDLLTFNNVNDLLQSASEIDQQATFYIDYSLGENELSGDKVIEKLQSLGFTKFYLASGYTRDYFDELGINIEVVGKEAPWV